MTIYNIQNQTNTIHDSPIPFLFQNKISINNKYGYDFDIALPTSDNFKIKPRYSALHFSNDRILNKSKIVCSDNIPKTVNNKTISEDDLANFLPHQNNIHLANPWKRIDN